MWIYGYRIKKNERLSHYQIQYIQDHVEKMVKKISDKQGIHLKKSVHSEACYLIINNQKEKYIISIRNHSSRRHFNQVIYLSNFKTWKELEKYFTRKVVPSFIESL